MRKLLLVMMVLFAVPALAQVDLTKSSIPPRRTYTTVNTGRDQVIIMTTTECHPPEKLLNKSWEILNTLHFDQPTRIIPPNGQKGPDYNPQRINFGVDQNGIIRAISCG